VNGDLRTLAYRRRRLLLGCCSRGTTAMPGALERRAACWA
jgi:hypothetical protein